MTQQKKDLQQLYIMDVKTLKIFNVNVIEIDECKFALFVFNEHNCCFNLRGANIQLLTHPFRPSCPQYIVSKDIESFSWIKKSFQWLLVDIGFILRNTWNNIYDEKFYSDKN